MLVQKHPTLTVTDGYPYAYGLLSTLAATARAYPYGYPYPYGPSTYPAYGSPVPLVRG